MTSPLLVFIGASGSGKSAVVRRLDERGTIRVHPTWTTRPRRRDERSGSVEHHFVSESEFLARRGDGFFLHSLQMFGLPHWYGLPAIDRTEPGVIDTVMLRAALVPILRAVYPDLVVYHLSASSALIKSRLAARGCDPRELGARLADNERERAEAERIADRTFTNDRPLSAVARDIEQTIRLDFRPSHQEIA